MLVPTVARVVQQLKGVITKHIGYSIWQTRFYDHVIRTERDYRDIYTYIDNNPAHWAEDEYYWQKTTRRRRQVVFFLMDHSNI